jgi:DNA mismatch repair ATPase MutS
VVRFDRETQFYLSWLDHAQLLSRSGLDFCYPELDLGKHVEITETFDVALAIKLAADRLPVVRNDILLHGPERIAVVTGANQGGKTTFARTVGQLHYVASLGLPIPGRRARLPLADRVYTHFEKQERHDNLRGKLEDDLERIRAILSRATGNSVVILNEVFTSTTAADAEQLGRRILQQLIDLDAVGVYVTFIDELASLAPAVASLVATVDPADPVRRTFVIRRQPADGRAYADTLADHYGLSYARLRNRLAS